MQDVLAELTAWGAARDAVRAMLLTSTRAVPGAPVDVLSDYDVILVLDDIRPFVDERSWVEDFGHVLVAYWDPVYREPVYGMDECGNVIQYADGLKIDFTLWSTGLFQRIADAPTLPAELDAGYRILLDKDGRAAKLAPPSYRAYLPVAPSEAAYQLVVNDFLTNAPYVAKCLWRDELLPAKWALDYDMKHLFLRQALEWYVGMIHAWSAPVGSLGKGLKKHLPSELWAQVEAAYAGASMDENWRALMQTLAVFRRVAGDVGAQLGYEYPDELHARVAAYVEQIRALAADENRLAPPP